MIRKLVAVFVFALASVLLVGIVAVAVYSLQGGARASEFCSERLQSTC